MTDPLGNVTTNQYDAKGNLLSVTSPAPDGNTPPSVTQFAYDTKGEITQITDPLSRVTNLTYTTAGLIQTITDAQQHVTSYEYDTHGNRTARHCQRRDITPGDDGALCEAKPALVTNLTRHCITAHCISNPPCLHFRARLSCRSQVPHCDSSHSAPSNLRTQGVAAMNTLLPTLQKSLILKLTKNHPIRMCRMTFLAITCLWHVGFFAINSYAVINSPQGKIKHVIIVIQENRTPDNLFYADSVLVSNGGNVRPPGNPPQGPCKLNGQSSSIALSAWKLDACFDPRHGHTDWVAMYDAPPPPDNGPGGMDGACNVRLSRDNCANSDSQHIPPCSDNRFQWCPEYTYVSQPIGLATYFDIAHKYGFANYMFQTNQGPSFPAHQFLFSGTSLPVPFSQDQTKSKWFAADNPVGGGDSAKIGCIAPPAEKVSLVAADGWPDCGNDSGPKCIYPCLDHNTIVNVVNATTPVRWRYYAHSEQDLWEAPAAVLNLCVPNNPPPNGTSCTGSDYINNVVYPTDNDKARILTDLADCSRIFPKVSFVIPDGKWSDHAGQEGHDGGPSWVGRIINAVGNSTCTGDDHANWSNTVVLVTWDDWGGWYDHVNPHQNLGGPGIGYNTQPSRDSSWYVYGFRVPLLVISAYNKHTPGSLGYNGYISGTTPTPVCPGPACHDFGSLLNFVEFTLGTGGGYLGTIGDGHSSYADFLAPDARPTCSTCDYSLSDFFDFDHSPTTFVPIGGFKYPETCFHQPDQAGCWPGSHAEDPDNDALEQ